MRGIEPQKLNIALFNILISVKQHSIALPFSSSKAGSLISTNKHSIKVNDTSVSNYLTTVTTSLSLRFSGVIR